VNLDETTDDAMKPNWFIGLPLRDHWVSTAVGGIPQGLRTFRGEDIHMTVAFLGAVDPEQARAAWLPFSESSRRDLGPAWDLVLGRTLPFGDPKCPSSLSVVPTPETAAKTTEFIGLHRNPIRTAAGLKPEMRTVRPHATIARIKRRAPVPLRTAALAWAELRPPLDVRIQVSEIALFTWTEDRGRQLFRIMERRSLDS
jgi:2'-5' RNA ligase